ncbi:esterase-like activity of phytase family protein [Actinokineospora sp. NBRC 105648]|uniref:esterase-like activity of phytase family protein n=1 Tax=Actinokineospora sp. NBRC 105648 TaxID=3032206 RepID=UPI0024A2E7AC|nr:esterase-like activity of phytase family protein [Actinokineospora sp. NBRC 105648]GLZ41984.1 glycosyl transferase family 1 [Actinokineospora sp. NBRC 105648]
MRRPLAIGLAAFAVCSLAVPSSAAPESDRGGPGRAALTQFAALPAETYVSASDPSGSLLGTAPVNGITPPFADQPVQGFSGIVGNPDGTFEVLSDNGYGTKANSADFVLRLHRIGPDFRSGAVDVLGGVNLTDPNRKVPFPLTRPDRVLTGADFDVESIVRAADGSYWIGDEFGPYLLHFDRAGRLLAPPVPLPGVFAPENPAGTPNLLSSKGFEGLALSPDRRTLNALLEGVVAGDSAGSLRLNEFDLVRGAYTDRRWTYQLDDPAYAIGDVTTVDRDRLLVIERDGGQGATAKVKKIYLADKRDRDHDGKLDKTLVADLLNLANPRHVGGFADPFTFPFQTIEDVAILDDRTLAVLNDNNFPFSSGRTPGKPDNNEFITVRLGERLHADPRVLRP